MDIYFKTNVDQIGHILKENGFAIKRKRDHYSAMHYISSGRYHFMYELIGRMDDVRFFYALTTDFYSPNFELSG